MFQSLLSVVGVCEGMKKMPVGWEMGLESGSIHMVVRGPAL